tara:strand:- start:786 stop:3035 length:2250 start_codon:yes stop_codon:yes gene_type:complete
MAATYQPPQWLIPENNNTNKVGNYSLNLDRIGDVINLGSSTLIGGRAALSVSVWFNTTDGTFYQNIMGAYAGGTGSLQKNFQIGIDVNASDTLKVIQANQTGTNNPNVAFNPVLAINTWYHLVVLYDGAGATNTDKIKVYLNNALLTSSSENGTIATTIFPFSDSDAIPYLWMGASGYNSNPPTLNLFDGELSELSIFDYVLSTDNITTLYGDSTNGVGNPMALASPPIGYWKGDKAGFGDEWALPNQVNYDQVFDFDQANDDGIDLASALTASDEFTLSYWTNPTGVGFAGYGYIVGQDSSSSNYILQDQVGRMTVRVDGATGYFNEYLGPPNGHSGANNIVLNTWQHFTIIRDSSDDIRVYRNGTAYGIETGLNFTGTFTWDAIGQIINATQYKYDGMLSNIAWWTSDQTANISTIYNNGTPGDLTSLSPVGWWKLDQSATWDGSNWSISDAGSGSNTGTSDNMTQANLVSTTLARSTSDSNYSFNFDGVGDEVDLSSAYTTTDQFTVSIWANSTAPFPAGTDYGYYFGDGGLGIGLQETVSGSYGQGIIYIWTGAAEALTTTAVTAGVWEHLVFVCDKTVGSNGEIKFYRNGVLDTTTTLATADLNNFTSIEYMGTHGSSWYYTGNLSNMSIWSSALSAANITTLYNNGKPGDLSSFSPTAVGWWKLGDDAFATVAASTAWTVPDQISTNNGTSAGNPTISGEAPGSSNNGLSLNMTIEDRTGESGQSVNNALSYNMATTARIAYT